MDGLEDGEETGRGGSGFVLAQSFSSAAISEVELGSSDAEAGGAARGLLYALLNVLWYGFGCNVRRCKVDKLYDFQQKTTGIVEWQLDFK